MRFLFFLISVAIGTLFIWKTAWVVEFTGRNGWAERTFGPTGTYTLIKLIGFVVICIGMLYATGGFERIFGGLFGTVFGGFAE